ncbi:hypothetical protein [Rhodococcus sp. BH5]|uniref:hypothetical protein n=1 Tax=Rhodococcus sp. BH5 TaxID=2871702 RepID=UPI0022CD5348|nr:hypothetical protein [Rhodococcus sp. BH5]MCZ9635029.1 hypothetical protein [Rhodococcus sp. BH5]
MTYSVPRATKTGLLAGAAVALPVAGALLGAPTANASPLIVPDPPSDLASLVEQVAQALPVAPQLPPLPEPIAALVSEGPLQNMLRKETFVGEATQSTPSGSGAPGDGGKEADFPKVSGADIAQAQLRAEFDNVAAGIGFLLDTPGSPEFGDQIGTLHARLLDRTGADLYNPATWPTAVERVLGEGIAEVTGSPEWAALWNTSYTPFGPHDGATPREQAVNGLADLIDSFVTNPAGTLTEALAIAGGAEVIAADPIGALLRVSERVIGAQASADLELVITRSLSNLGEAIPYLLGEIWPAVLPIIVGAVGGSTLGGLLLGSQGALLGGALGALTPLAILAGLLGALPGAALGGAATGLVGLLGSLLLTLPTLLGFPLLGAAAGSALAVIVLGTVLFGGWLLFVGVAMLPVIALGLLAGLAVAAVIVIAGSVGTGGIGLPWFAITGITSGIAAAAAVIVIALLTLTALTFLIPIVAFVVLAPLVVLGSAGLGALAGLAASAAFIALAVPLLTALSVIPGAIIGAILGYLTADLLTRLVSAVLGAVLLGISAAILGSVVGGVLGALAGTPLAIILALALGIPAVDAWIRSNRDSELDAALARLLGLAGDAWNQSIAKSVLDRIGRFLQELSKSSGWDDFSRFLGERFAPLASALADLWESFLAGDADPDNIVKGSVLGALAGALLGSILGFLIGTLDPKNLLAAIPGFILGSALSAPLGALLGALASTVLGALAGLASIPLTFLPNLLALAALSALAALPLILGALAASLVPPLVLGIMGTILVGLIVSSPLWVPLMIVSAITLVVTVILVVGSLAGWVVPGLNIGLGVLAGITGAIAAIGATAWAVVIIAALVLAAAVIGIPVFLLTLPLFLAPALLAPLLWLASLPLLFPMALGLSLLESVPIGGAVALASMLATVPLGALAGGLTLGTISAVLSVIGTALMHGLFDALIGGLLLSAPGAVLGALIGALLPKGALESLGGRILADPMVAGTSRAATAPAPTAERTPVPTVASPTYGTTFTGTPTADRSLVEIPDEFLVGV